MNSAFKGFALLVCAILSVSIFSACQKEESRSTGSSGAATPSRASEPVRKELPGAIQLEIRKVAALREDRTNLDLFKRDLNLYELKISMPDSTFNSNEDLEIRLSVNSSSVDPKFSVLSKANAVFESGNFVLTERINPWSEDCLPKTIAVRIYSRDQLLGEIHNEYLPDLFIPGNQVTDLSILKMSSGDYKFDSIFMESGSVLNTHGAVVNMTANLMIADNAKIETMSEEEANTAAPEGQPGKDGGSIEIRANKGMGTLQFSMRGGKGGKGRDVKENERPAQLTQKGVKGTPGEAHRTVIPGTGPMDICDKPPGNGQKGPKGTRGFDGGAGFSGGSTGILVVAIEKEIENFNVNLIRQPGAGGNGGLGGKGGLGGPGGDPGDLGKFDGCRLKPGSIGNPGDNGDDGLNGQPGSNGQEEPVRVIISGQVRF